MKFKTIFIIFNLVIVFSFLVIFFMPLLLLGAEHFSEFFRNNWYISLLFIATLAIFNSYFIANWRLFQLLEREDWLGLIEYLEHKVFEQRKIQKNYIKILVNSYLVTSQPEAILKLKDHVEQMRPKLIKQFSVAFGLPYLLTNKSGEAERYYGKLLAQNRIRERAWIRWNYGFSLLQVKEAEGAKKEFFALLESNNPVIVLLSLYLLSSFALEENGEKSALDGKAEEIRSRYSKTQWEKKLNRYRSNLQAMIFSRLIAEASNWLFQTKQAPKEETVH
jgi:hypothetical protein